MSAPERIAESEKLRAEVDYLRAHRNNLLELASQITEEYHNAASDNFKLAARINKLEAALREALDIATRNEEGEWADRIRDLLGGAS